MKPRVIWCFLECLCFSGLTGGWDILFWTLAHQDLLINDRNWSCPIELKNSTDTYDSLSNFTGQTIEESQGNETDLNNCVQGRSGYEVVVLRLVPGVTSAVCTLLVVPLGVLYDKYGTLKSRLVAIFLFTTSTLMTTFMTSDCTWLLVISWIFMECSGFLILLTNLQIGNTSLTRRCTIIMIYCAANKCSPLMIILVQMTADYSTVQTAFMFLTVVLIPLLVGTIAFLPRKRLHWPDPQCESPNSLTVYFGKRKGANEALTGDTASVEVRPLGTKSWLFFTQMMWFSGLFITIKLIPELRILRQVDTVSWSPDSKRHVLYSSMLIMPACALVGWTLDRYATHKEENIRRRVFMRQLCLCFTIIGFLVAVNTVLSYVIFDHVIPDLWIVPDKILDAICLGVQTVMLSTIFPYHNFGTLLGVTMITLQLLNVLVYTIVYVVSIDMMSRLTVFLVSLIIMLPTSFNILNKWRWRDSSDIITFKPSCSVVEAMARATLTMEAAPSSNSLDNLETEEID